MSCEETKWLSKLEDIPDANMASLKRSLLTGDGMGEKFKERVLSALIMKVREEERSRMAREELGL